VLSIRATPAPLIAAQGERERALAMVDDTLTHARAWGLPRPIATALAAKGVVAVGDAGLELLREACPLFARAGAPLEQARAQIELGAALRRANRRAEAREPLRAGLDGAQRCGAIALASRARDELRANGARPRRLMLSGADALTPSELRVAGMAADGLRNREIAQALFVTVKTVDMHLSRVFRKLDIHRRADVAAALTTRGGQRAVGRLLAVEATAVPNQPESPVFRGFHSAPERSRTSTDHTVHMALNLVQKVEMLPGVSKSSKLVGLLDALDVMNRMDVATGVGTPSASGALGGALPGAWQ
jgi:DNA-binding CsgD family transcriptional regulator